MTPDLDALEQRILGTILLHPSAMDRVGELTSEDFRHDAHRDAFSVAMGLYAAGKTPTPWTVAARMPDEEIAPGMAPAAYLTSLAGLSLSLITFADEVATLVEHARRRRLIGIAQELLDDAARGDTGVDALVERTEQALYGLSELRPQETTGTLKEAADEALAVAEAAYQRGEGLSGIATGIGELDRLMGGLQASDLIIVAARPGMGKTSLATCMAQHLAASDIPCAFFSLEMSAEQLATRTIAERARIPSSRIRRGAISEAEFYGLMDAAGAVGRLPVYVDQSGGLSIAQLAIRARRLKRTKGIGAVFVDYIQLMSGSGKNRQANRVNEITEITTGLKALAKELGVPVVALSQLSREVEKRDDKRPRLSDLRESGSIEQDADVVAFVYREEYYLAQAKPKEGTDDFFAWEMDMERAHGRAEIIIAKQRHGPCGTVNVRFDASLTSFQDVTAEAAQ